MNGLKVLHIADIHINPAYVVERATSGFNGRLYVLADLASLFSDISDAGNAAVGSARCHAGYEYKTAGRFDRGCVRENAVRLP
jgi:hypothetical protein